MTTRLRWLLGLLALVAGGAVAQRVIKMTETPKSERLAEVQARVLPGLQAACSRVGFQLGAPVLVRIFKESKELELWMEKGGSFALFKSYPISNWGHGKLGPKLMEGDGQAPEGFYEVGVRQLNPQSNYHLAFNLGYPNAYDQARGRTGSFLMVHGGSASVGCYAMTDPQIEEIYCLVDAALKEGQGAFQVQCYPFRKTAERLAQVGQDPWLEFWQNLAEGDALFLKTLRPVKVSVRDGRYVFED
jgi:murein L,D-transpeptidase YafK